MKMKKGSGSLLLILFPASLVFHGCREEGGGYTSRSGDPVSFFSTTREDLPEGVRAEARVGDVVMMNDLARYVIQSARDGVRYAFFGGNLIDGEPLDAEGNGSGDRMMEIFPLYHYIHTPDAADVSLENEGDTSRVFVFGSDYYLEVTEILSSFAYPLPITVLTTYTMRRDSPWIEMETEFSNLSEEEIEFDAGDALILGKNLEGESPGHDEDDYGAEGIISFSDGEIAYAYLHPEGAFDVLLEYGSLGLTFLEELHLPPYGTASVTRAFATAEGGTADGISLALGYLGHNLLPLKGYVVDEGSAPVEGARVEARSDEGRYYGWTVTRADGSFLFQLPAGLYYLTARADDRRSSGEVEAATGAGVAVLVIGARGCIRAEAAGSEGDPLPFRITAVGSDGSRWVDFSFPEGTLCLPPDRYTVYLSRGQEYSLETFDLEVEADSFVDLGVVTLAREVSSPGFVTGDFHIHHVGSPDSDLSITKRCLSLGGEGIEWAVSTDHEAATDYNPYLESLGISPFVLASRGEEVTPFDYGHFNVWPLDPLLIDPDEPLSERGAWKWLDKEDHTFRRAEELFSWFRSTFGQDMIISVNHPRTEMSGYFNTIDFDHETCDGLKEELSLNFDALEVRTDIDGQAGADWFALLNCGIRKTAVGVSDSHGLTGVGYPKTFIRASSDEPSELTEGELIENLREGRALVSCGIFTNLMAESEGSIAEVGDTLFVQAGSPIEFTLIARAPSWIDSSCLSLIHGGERLPLKYDDTEGLYRVDETEGETIVCPEVLATEEGGKEMEIRVLLPFDADSWVIGVADGEGSLYPLDSCSPLGYTNPIFIEVY